MARFVVYAKRTDECQAQLRMFCVTDDKEDKALERIERFIQVAKSRDVEVILLFDKIQHLLGFPFLYLCTLSNPVIKWLSCNKTKVIYINII